MAIHRCEKLSRPGGRLFSCMHQSEALLSKALLSKSNFQLQRCAAVQTSAPNRSDHEADTHVSTTDQ
jgi:hypothetical protein